MLFGGTIRYNLDPFIVYIDADICRALEQVNQRLAYISNQSLKSLYKYAHADTLSIKNSIDWKNDWKLILGYAFTFI